MRESERPRSGCRHHEVRRHGKAKFLAVGSTAGLEAAGAVNAI